MKAREILLQSAFNAFLAHGYDGTGVVQILDGTDLSKGAFYYHFKSKLDLFEAMVLQFLPSPFTHMDWAAHGALGVATQKQAISALYAQLTAISADMGADMLRYYALFFDALSHLPNYRGEVHAGYQQLIAALSKAIASEEGLTPTESDRLARAFIAGFEGDIYLSALSAPLVPQISGDT